MAQKKYTNLELLRILGAGLLLVMCSGCATPVTMLKNPKTGQVVRCGGGKTGSVAGGMIGYSIEKDGDAKCVQDYEKQGFKQI